MSAESVSPRKRYILRALDLAKNDLDFGQLSPDNSIREKALKPGLSLNEVIAVFLDGYENRPALGARDYKLVEQDGETVKYYLPSYHTITYGQLHERVKALAMAFRHQASCKVDRDQFVMIMGFADMDYVTLDLACAYAKAVRVPIQSSSSGADLNEMVATIQPVMMATTIEDLALTTELAKSQESVKSIVVFNYDARVSAELAMVNKSKADLKNAKSTKRIFTISELIQEGKAYDYEHLSNDDDELQKRTAIIHSSGSTGKPKGAVIRQDAFIYRWIGQKGIVPKVTVLLAPLNHVMGRLNMMGTLNCGGTGYFTLQPDLSTLLEDIRLARPSYLSLFPRVFELVYQHFQNEVSRRLTDDQSRVDLEKTVMLEMSKSYLGDRLLCVVFGSAPTSKKVQDFIQDCFDVLMIEGYGNTESGSASITMDNKIVREVILDYKLRDVPELGYFTTDKPNPRGELVIKSKYGIKEYYKQPETTAALFDKEGYARTGDIVEEIGPDEVIVIDRKKDVLKLSHGEYVATGTLGTIYEAGSALVKQIYVYGHSTRSYLLAVVVPEHRVIENRLGEGASESAIKNLIRAELNQIAQKEELRKFEVPRDFILEYEPFSQENGLLSSVRKRLRPALKRKYGAALDAIYQLHEQSQDEKISALKTADSKLSTVEKLIILLEHQLKVDGITAAPARNFSELGGDSLGATLYSMYIEEIFGVAVPADVILSPMGSLHQWAKYIDDTLNPMIQKQATFDTVHKKGSVSLHEDDIQLYKFISDDTLSKAAHLPKATKTPKTVLLTGANGFLGHIVALEWLQVLSKRDGKLICLVREQSDSAAFQKLAKEFKGLDARLESEFSDLAHKHLEVVAGDIGKPNLGWSAERFVQLSQDVDRICHVGALVNHRLGYQHLFGPNVVGTAEIIKLAITEKNKPIDFISSVSVFPHLDASQGINESTPFNKEVQISNAYANGYGLSKWAAEILLRRLHTALGVPIQIFRCDMILPDQRYQGQANTSDMLTRLLYSIALTGLAPNSFYALGDGRKAHYTGVPVDILAKTIVNVHATALGSYHVYHAINYLKDQVSLDRFVDWIQTAGYKVDRINDHQDWYTRMETKLKALPAEQRKKSVLDVLIAYRRPTKVGHHRIHSDHFESLIESMGDRNNFDSLSESYIHKYMQDIELLNG